MDANRGEGENLKRKKKTLAGHNTIISLILKEIWKKKTKKMTIHVQFFRRVCVCESILYLYLIIPDDQEMFSNDDTKK